MRIVLLVGINTMFAFSAFASAEVLEFEDKAAWEAAVGDYTTIDFTGYPYGTLIRDQYLDVGVRFMPDCWCTIAGPNFNTFLNDGWGLDGNDLIHIQFDSPQHWIAADFPGALYFELYSDGELLYSSSLFGGGGVGHFGGLISDESFNEVLIQDWDAFVILDDLHFGVPTPAGFVCLALAALIRLRARRT
jgi:hypothetical protein